jgi:MFS family permease
MLYGIILCISLTIISNYYKKDDISFFIIFIVVSSLIAFICTYIISLIFLKLKRHSQFEAWFEWIHFTIIYASGLISLLIVLQPELLKFNIIKSPINTNETYLSVSLIFFIAISNYNFYKNISSKQGSKVVDFIKTIWHYLRYYSKEYIKKLSN